MYIGRFQYQDRIFYGQVKKEEVQAIEGDIFGKYHLTENIYRLTELKILPPSLPCKIILVGLNYRDHAEEMKFSLPEEPVLFLKPTTTLIAHKENIIYPENSRQVDYEAELALIVKDECYRIQKKDAKKYIFGYTCLNDVTARDLQKKDGQWTRAKSFNTFCPTGPYIYAPQQEFDPHNLQVRTYLNGEIKQDSNTKNLIFSVEHLLWFISQIMTLYPGDIISTGTPGGIGPMQVNDEVTVEVERIGNLVNRVVK